MNYNKKGQAAMEFLMTYGWAILAAIVVIAVLAIYFRPSQVISGNQVLTAPFNALGVSFSGASNDVTNNGSIILEFKNNGGEDVTISGATVSIKTPNSKKCNAAVPANFTGLTGGKLETGGISRVTFDTCTFATDLNVNADVTISYTSGDGTLVKTASGSISGKAP